MISFQACLCLLIITFAFAQQQSKDPLEFQSQPSKPTVQHIQAQPDSVEPQVVQPIPVNPQTAQPTNPEPNQVPNTVPPIQQPPVAINTQSINIAHQVPPPPPSNPADPNSQPTNQTQTSTQQSNLTEPNVQQIQQKNAKNNQQSQNENQSEKPQQNNYQETDQQRSARYRAEQQRLQQLRRRQQQQEIRYIQDAKITRYQEAKNNERTEMASILETEGYEIPKKTVLFEVDRQIEQFILTPTSDQTITFSMLIYTLQNNAYGFVKDIDTSKPLKVYVYEDNNRIVAQGQFFFQKALKFQARKGSYYAVRFYNSGQAKLISFTYPSMIQSTHVENLYKKQKGEHHLYKINVFESRVEEITQRLKRNSLLDRVNNETMMGFFKKYSGYQFVEMLVVLVVCGFQVHVVKKLFKSDSIL